MYPPSDLGKRERGAFESVLTKVYLKCPGPHIELQVPHLETRASQSPGQERVRPGIEARSKTWKTLGY